MKKKRRKITSLFLFDMLYLFSQDYVDLTFARARRDLPCLRLSLWDGGVPDFQRRGKGRSELPHCLFVRGGILKIMEDEPPPAF